MLSPMVESNKMKNKSFLIVILTSIIISTNAQNFGTFSGTIRIGGGLYGTCFSYGVPVTVGLLQGFGVTDFDFNKWSNEQHTFMRYFNIGGDLLIPKWSMSASNTSIELHRPLEDYQTNFLNHTVRQYTNYVGYYFNWDHPFTRIGCYFGADYEWKSFVLFYPYPNTSYNKIQALIPAAGLRYRLISPRTEMKGFPFNVVLESGLSFVIHTKYENSYGYGLDALNNGFRPMLGVAVTTYRFGSIHLRWTKDLYQLFNNNYTATDGFLYNNKISNNFSCYSIGWAIFL